MRKIEREMIEALKEHRYFRKSNTTVLENVVILHDNCIFKIEQGTVIFNSCGWYSATTKSRLNAIMHWLGMGHIEQKKYKWFYTDGASTIPFSTVEGKSISLSFIMNATAKSNMDRAMKLNGLKECGVLFMGVTSTYRIKEEV